MVVPNQMISDFVGLSWSRLEAHHLLMLVMQFSMFVTASEMQCDGWMVRELRVVSVEVVVDVMLFDHCRKILSISHKFNWPKD